VFVIIINDYYLTKKRSKFMSMQPGLWNKS